MKEWFSAAEIARLDLPDLPATESGVIRAAKAGRWHHRLREGRGGGREYPLSALPPPARAAYVLRHLTIIDVPLAVSSDADNQPEADGLTPVTALQRDARLAILATVETYARTAAICQKQADRLFCAAYGTDSIEVASWVRTAITSVTLRTLARWRAARTAGATHRLAVDKGATRRGKGVLEIANHGAVSAAVMGLISKRPGISAHQVRNILIGTFGLDLSLPDGRVVPVPPIRTIQVHMARLRADNEQILLRVTNPDAWKSKFRVSGLTRHNLISRPLELVPIDASPADVLLIDGRHSIYVALDHFSRRFIITVTRTPRAEAVQLLLRRIILDWGIPEMVFTDNGSDFVANSTKRFMAAMGIEVQTADAFAPEQKGTVERAIGTVQRGLMTLLDGFAGHSVAERKAIENRKAFSRRLGADAAELLEVAMTAADLQSACDRWVTAYENRRHTTLGTTPVLRWAQYSGSLRRPADERSLDVLLAPIAGDNGMRQVQKLGIRVDNAWFVLSKVQPGERVFCRQHPTDLGRLLVFSADGQTYRGEAVNPERVGVSRAAAVAAARAVQSKINKEGTAALRKATRRYDKPNAMLEAYLAGAIADSPNVTILPNRRSTPVETPEMAAAAQVGRKRDREVDISASVRTEMEADFEAGLSGRPVRAPAEVVELERAEARFLRAVALEDRTASGIELSEAETRWLAGYQLSVEYRSSRELFEEFGRSWFEERAAG